MVPGSVRRIRLAKGVLSLIVCLVIGGPTTAAEGPRQFLNQPNAWFGSAEAQQIADNILAHQSALGGWPKNVATTSSDASKRTSRPTFDNGATTDELRFLARVYNATQNARYREAFEKGLDYVLQAQYPNGGWPQYFPPGRGYHRHITFNDNAMVRLMQFVREVAASNVYRFVDADRRAASRQAFDRGVECILACQIKVDGQLAVWCAQHDEVDFRPRPARSYELISLSGAESVEIVRLLMTLEKPSPEVVQSIEAAITWFEGARLTGIRQVTEVDAKAPKGKNKVIVQDASAPPLWARFYEIGTNRPIFVDRDGVARYDLAEISYERRNGYGWLNDRPRRLLEQDYPAWKANRSVAE